MIRVALVTFAVACGGCSMFTRDNVRTAADAVVAVCELTLAERPAVKAEAARRKMSPREVAAALCAIAEVVQPFLAARDQAADEAIAQADRKGLVRP